MGNSRSKDAFVAQVIDSVRDKAVNHAQCDDLKTLEEFKQELIKTRAMHLQILKHFNLVCWFVQLYLLVCTNYWLVQLYLLCVHMQ